MKKQITIIILTLIVMNGKSQVLNGNYLDINNVKAPVAADGGLFQYGTSGTQVPKGSGKTTLYSSALWLGGYDSGGQLKMAAQTYRQNGNDFFPGPIDSTGTYGAAYDATWNRVWKIKQCDIQTYYDWITVGGIGPNPLLNANDSAAMETINNWPAFNMYGAPLAPFYDYNGDGQYDPAAGDVPKIKGDEAIFFVYNDARGPHTESGGSIIGIEVQGMAYAYSCSYDSALYNTVFTNYKIINKGSFQLDSSFIGNWTDMDIGDYSDDYMGCDVGRGAYFGYNGDNIDGTGQATAYGANPPAEGVVLLKGPLKNPNGIDDAASTTPNGTNYGNGISDDERLGMSRFMCFNNTGTVNGNPTATDDYYQYLSGSWKNATPWKYGGNGLTGNTICNYMFPGSSDPSGFGTNIVPQAAWDETTSGQLPQEIRGIGSTGPFTLQPHQIQTIDFAYVYGRASQGGNLASVAIIKNRIDSIRQKFSNGLIGRNWSPSYPNWMFGLCGCNSATGINEINNNQSIITIFPNPASDNITINYTSVSKNYTITIYNAMGSLVKTIADKNASVIIPIGEFASGIYLLNVLDGNNSSVKRFVKE